VSTRDFDPIPSAPCTPLPRTAMQLLMHHLNAAADASSSHPHHTNSRADTPTHNNITPTCLKNTVCCSSSCAAASLRRSALGCKGGSTVGGWGLGVGGWGLGVGPRGWGLGVGGWGLGFGHALPAAAIPAASLQGRGGGRGALLQLGLGAGGGRGEC